MRGRAPGQVFNRQELGRQYLFGCRTRRGHGDEVRIEGVNMDQDISSLSSTTTIFHPALWGPAKISRRYIKAKACRRENTAGNRTGIVTYPIPMSDPDLVHTLPMYTKVTNCNVAFLSLCSSQKVILRNPHNFFTKEVIK